MINDDETKTKLAEWLEEHDGNEALCAAIRDAVAKYGEDEIAVLTLGKPAGEIAIFRTPSSSEYKRFMANILDDKPATKAAAAEIMARNCVLYPEKKIFAGWCERYGAIGSSVLKSLSKLAGAELADRGKE